MKKRPEVLKGYGGLPLVCSACLVRWARYKVHGLHLCYWCAKKEDKRPFNKEGK